MNCCAAYSPSPLPKQRLPQNESRNQGSVIIADVQRSSLWQSATQQEQQAQRSKPLPDQIRCIMNPSETVWRWGMQRMIAWVRSFGRSSSGRTSRAAVLIDAENCPPMYADAIMAIVRWSGDPMVRRIYANWHQPQHQAWLEAIARYQLEPVHHPEVRAGKNAIDILIAVDAIELATQRQIDRVYLVAGDSDYTPLIRRLRMRDIPVAVLSPRAPSPSVQAVATCCIVLPSVGTSMPAQTMPTAALPGEPRRNGRVPADPLANSRSLITVASPSDRSQEQPNPATPSHDSSATGSAPVSSALPIPSQESEATSNGRSDGRPVHEAVAILESALRMAHRRRPNDWVLGPDLVVALKRLDPKFRYQAYGVSSLARFIGVCMEAAPQRFSMRTTERDGLMVRLIRDSRDPADRTLALDLPHESSAPPLADES